MSQPFDPYTKWLGLSEQERPPNHYQLLGLNEFESNVEIIRSAGEKRTRFLQDVSTGERVAEAQRLLNQVASAVLCLTSSEKKNAYDAQLRSAKQFQSTTKPAARKPSPPQKTPSKSIGQTKVSQKAFPLWGYLILPVVIGIGWGVWQWAHSGGNRAHDRLTERRGQSESGQAISIDFDDVSSVDSIWQSAMGQWEFGVGVRIEDARDEGQKYLHLTGGKSRIATVQLSTEVDRYGILTLQAERWSVRGEFEFRVQESMDGLNWQDIAREAYGGEIKKRAKGSVGPSWRVIYQLSNPETTHLRLVCDSADRRDPETGGALISRIMIDPPVR